MSGDNDGRGNMGEEGGFFARKSGKLKLLERKSISSESRFAAETLT